jgi:hypothetical protein
VIAYPEAATAIGNGGEIELELAGSTIAAGQRAIRFPAFLLQVQEVLDTGGIPGYSTGGHSARVLTDPREFLHTERNGAQCPGLRRRRWGRTDTYGAAVASRKNLFRKEKE